MGKEMMTGSDEAPAGASTFLFPAGSAAGLAAAALSFSTACLAAKTEADSFAGGAGGGSGLILDRADRKAFGQKGKNGRDKFTLFDGWACPKRQGLNVQWDQPTWMSLEAADDILKGGLELGSQGQTD